MRTSLAVLFSLSFLAPSANADCVKDRSGNVVCGAGQCAADIRGVVYCAQAGGGAIWDRHGDVVCGAGSCAKDSYLEVWCSREPGGGAAVDSYGKVKCLGEWEPASAERCVAGR